MLHQNLPQKKDTQLHFQERIQYHNSLTPSSDNHRRGLEYGNSEPPNKSLKKLLYEDLPI